MAEKGQDMAQVQVMLSTQPTPNQPAPMAERMVWLSMEGSWCNKSREAPSDHGLHRAHTERKISRIDRRRRNPPEALPEECSHEGKAEGLSRD